MVIVRGSYRPTFLFLSSPVAAQSIKYRRLRIPCEGRRCVTCQGHASDTTTARDVSIVSLRRISLPTLPSCEEEIGYIRCYPP